ncbi:hypothetical protein LSAT2_026677 [Lamellibrachia satsuma]|nr:hypothetical protein LSAT2_026677 [Lamellibrachia satsuma]
MDKKTVGSGGLMVRAPACRSRGRVELCVEGLLGITLDHHDILLVNIKEVVSLKKQPDNVAADNTATAPGAASVNEVELSESSKAREGNQNEEPEDSTNNEIVMYVERMSTGNGVGENFSHQIEPLETPRSKVPRYDDSAIQQVECIPVAMNDIPVVPTSTLVATSGAPPAVKEEPFPGSITPQEPQLTITHTSGIPSIGRFMSHDRHTDSTQQVKTPGKRSHKAPVIASVSQPPVGLHQPPPDTSYDGDHGIQLQHAPIMSRLLMGSQSSGLDVISEGHVTAGMMTTNNGSNDLFDYMTAGAFGNTGLALHTETHISTVSSHNAIREVKLFSCPQCSFTSKRKFNVERHVLRLHYVRCDKCHKFFRSELDLKSYHLPHCQLNGSTATSSTTVLAALSSVTDPHHSGGTAQSTEHAGKSRSSEHAGISFPMEAASLAHLAEVIGASRSNTAAHHSSEPKSTVRSMEHSGKAKSPEHIGKSKSHQVEYTDVLHPSDNTRVGHTSKDTRSSRMAEHSTTSHMAEHAGTLHMAEHTSLHHPAIDHGPTQAAPEHMNLHMPHLAAEHSGMALAPAEHMVNVHVSHKAAEHSGMTPAAVEPMIDMHMSHHTAEHPGMDHSGLFYHLTDRAPTSHT